MSIVSAPPALRHLGVAAVGFSAVFTPAQAHAHETSALECLCETLPFLDTAPTWRAAALASAGAAAGEPAASVESEVDAQRRIMAEQRALIDRQSAMIAEQGQQIAKLQQQIVTQQAQVDRLSSFALAEAPLDIFRGTGMGQGVGPGPALPGPGSDSVALPDAPVGEAPPPGEPPEQRVAAVPEGQGVLTRAGELFFEPSFEYTRSSTNRLVFRGIELIPGIQIGLIEATDADRDTLVGTASLRYGITDRLEAEVRLPYLYRNDRIEVVQQRDEGIVRQIKLREDGIGDAEFSLRYQFNRPVGQKPIFVGTLRVKSDTGKGPFEIGYDEFGVATGLATGSGFWAVQPGLNFLMPSDPAVIYGGAAYLYHIPRDVNELVGDVLIGRVDPGDAISANIGFGFALNPRFSFSLGYRHNYIFPTKTEIGDTRQKSNYIHVGSLNFGMSYRLTQRDVLNLGFEIGVTEDAPDVSITLRMPFGGK
ncbi:transporter [Sphingopyxis sp. JAI108]|uniref:transporter n=1 Tax=Sphingopyxis sp. JAI108 TaxID=2723060 RepID=UPI0015CE08F7|nr:transporter [Sphingopyxis sp. JAI108]NYF34068.1 putative coiled-coil protein SlyX [Sphingopyxis sp. JAI108]